MERLSSPQNNAYLRSAAVFVGAAAALSKPRQAIITHKASNFLNDIDPIAVPQKDSTNTASKLKVWSTKIKGGNLQPPPPMSSKEAAPTFFGAFVTLVILSRLSEEIKEASDNKYLLVLGPFGALMTLQYGLVMAPASQPRNAFYGQMVAISIALLFDYIPKDYLSLWLRVPLATATSISALTRLGITHLPAGASALITPSGSYDWMVLPVLLLGNVIAVVTATHQ